MGIVTNEDRICAICGRTAECKHHLIFGRGLKKLGDEDDIYIMLCHKCHNMGDIESRIHDNPMAEKLSKMVGQLAFEKKMVSEGMPEDDAREEFRKRYGISYL